MTTPTLDDGRIEKMRLSVMHRVDQDVRRRGHRLRSTIGLTAASVLVVGLGGYALSSIDTPTGDSSGAESSSAQDSGGGRADIAPDAGSGSGDLANGTRKEAAAPDADRQVITTGTVRVTVTDPRTTAQRLSVWVESIGGRVDDRSENGSGDDASASVTVRVPSDRVTATIDRLKTYGTVEDVSVQNSDVTAQAKDLDARIDALQLSIDRLERILADSDTSGELIKAESALTERQEQLESLQAQRKGIADQVSLSTLSIDLSQRTSVDSVEPGGFGGGLRDGWNALVSTLNVVVGIAGRLLPWAAILVVGLGIVRLLGRRRTSRG
ncbi:MAG: DUF4349 domain-containing protein [Aeromicrobium sp.]